MTVRLIDLSQEIYQGMPVYPGHLNTTIWDYDTHESTGKKIKETFNTEFSYETRGLILCDHGPTHVDAVNHMTPDKSAKSIDELPLETFYTSAICLDFSFVKPNTYITSAMLKEACQKAGLEIRRGDTVLLYTGHYEKNYGGPTWLTAYPGLNRESSEWLADQGVVNVGIDAPSVDIPVDKSWPAHTVGGERGLLNTENMANLGAVAGKRFQFIGLPLKIRKGSASPIRAVAVLEE